MYLNRKKSIEAKKLYNKILNMPYFESIEEYEETYREVIRSNHITKESISYLKKRDEYCDQWVKAYMKDSFTGGTCTTSRIESKHAIYKRF